MHRKYEDKEVKVLEAQSCRTLCHPMDCIAHHVILQARILEWVAIPFSRGSAQLRDRTQVSCISRQILYHLSHQEYEDMRLFFFSPLNCPNNNIATLRHFFGEGNGTPLQYYCLQNPMDGGAWWATVLGVTKSRTLLSDFTFTFCHEGSIICVSEIKKIYLWLIPVDV